MACLEKVVLNTCLKRFDKHTSCHHFFKPSSLIIFSPQRLFSRFESTMLYPLQGGVWSGTRVQILDCTLSQRVFVNSFSFSLLFCQCFGGQVVLHRDCSVLSNSRSSVCLKSLPAIKMFYTMGNRVTVRLKRDDLKELRLNGE